MAKHAIITAMIIMWGFSDIQSQTRQGSDQLQVNELMTEYLKNPLGIDQLAPRFYWVLETQRPNTLQTHYQIQVASQSNFSRRSIVWDTDRYPSAQSIHVSFDGNELQSTTRYFWRVRIWDNHGRRSAWSETAWFETGFLNNIDWSGNWIGVPWEEDKTASEPVAMFRKDFSTNGRVASARLYATSLGLYEAEINGQKVGDQLFTPGWNAYSERLQYQTYDITDMLNSGNNAIGVMLGDGWYRGFIGWGSKRNYYGDKLALKAMIQITYTNGNIEIISTDATWKTSTGPILKSDIYNGEYYDARLEKEGWSRAGYENPDWQSCVIMPEQEIALIVPQAPPVKKIQEIPPVSVFTTPQGDTVIDFGQNVVGHVKLKVEGEKGTKVTLRHAETLDKDGNFYTKNLRSADQINVYVLRGEGTETWEPRFSFQGFRYIAVSGHPGNIDQHGAFTAVAIHSEMEPTGHFDCSNPLINQLQHNIVWGQKGNFLDVPTDCPQRDERL
jgi:alpha-L-rhamnosidase